MFSLQNFIQQGLMDAIGKMADYQIILNAANWYEKGVLTEENLAEIESAIEIKNTSKIEEDIIIEEDTALPEY